MEILIFPLSLCSVIFKYFFSKIKHGVKDLVQRLLSSFNLLQILAHKKQITTVDSSMPKYELEHHTYIFEFGIVLFFTGSKTSKYAQFHMSHICSSKKSYLKCFLNQNANLHKIINLNVSKYLYLFENCV